MFALKNRKQNLRKSPKLSLIRRKQSRSGSRTTRINITQWFARKGGRGTRRTRDRDMRVGEHRPMLMVPVSMYRVVPIRAVGADSGRWVRGRRQRRIKQRGLHGCAIQQGTIQVLVELVHLQLETLHSRINLRLPGVERRGCRLQRRLQRVNASVRRGEVRIQLVVEVGEAAVELVGEALRHLVENGLDGGIHRSMAALKPGKVVMGRRLQNRRNLIPGLLGAVRTRQGIASNWKREQNWGIGRGQIGGGIIFSYNSVHVVHLSLPTGSIRYRSAGCWAGSFSSLASAELLLWAFL